MVKIMTITQEEIQRLFEYRDGGLYWKIRLPHTHIKIGDHAGFKHQSGYRIIKINNIIYTEHRLVYLYHLGFIQKMLDHIDGVKDNNHIENLRPTTHIKNGQNRKIQGGSSRFKGVSWHKEPGKWMVQITVNMKHKYLGIFVNEIEAAKTYNKAAIKYFGEFARLNKFED